MRWKRPLLPEPDAGVGDAGDQRVMHKLRELGYTLPNPASAIANYVPVMRAGDLVFTSGQLPIEDGRLLARGRVGDDVTVDTAHRCAQFCALNALAALRAELGSLSSIRSVVKVLAAVASPPGFAEQSLVANGASDLLVAVFGDIGRHARTVLGVAALPLGAPVEVELTVRVDAGFRS